MKSFISKRYFLATVVSSLLSIFTVAVVAYGATMTISSTGLGSGTSTPGAALGVQGAAIVDDFVWTGWLVGTSTAHASGFGTTTPGADFAVAGSALFDGKVTGDYFNATSTTATSSIRWSLTAATSTFQVDGVTGRVVIGATTTLPQSGGMLQTGGNSEIGLTITGTGNAANATGTIYVAGAGASGGQLIIKSSDGNNCVSIMAQTGAVDPETAATLAANLLTFRVVACPK
ncbi:MAG: hypothetical protein AAB501_00205 [Patescibacteria group bacterium]